MHNDDEKCQDEHAAAEVAGEILRDVPRLPADPRAEDHGEDHQPGRQQRHQLSQQPDVQEAGFKPLQEDHDQH